MVRRWIFPSICGLAVTATMLALTDSAAQSQTQPGTTVSSTETSLSPTPTSPSAADGEQICLDPSAVLEGSEELSLGDYYASGNIWNDNGQIEQTMGVCSHDSWYVEVAAADHEDRAVLSYPNVHRDWHDWSTGSEPRIDSFSSITSRFAHQAPDTGVWNVAYDIWINGVGNGPGTTELMIWTQNSQQRPAGSPRGTVTVDGRVWELWTTSDNLIVSYVAVEPLTSAELDLKAFMQHLMDTGRLAPDSTLGQIGYGVEIVQTGGRRLRFDFTDFYVVDVDRP